MSQHSFRNSKSNTQSLLLVTALFISLTTQTLNAQKRELVDKIKALVEGTPILHSTVVQKSTVGPLVSLSPYPATKSSSKYEQALQDSINMKIMLDSADQLGINADEEMVSSSIDQFLKRQKSSKSQLKKYLKSQGQSYDKYKSDFKDQIVMQRFQQRVILPSVKVEEKDINSFYQKSSGLFAKKARLDIRQLVIKGGPEKVKKVYAALKNMSFSDAINKYSDGPKGKNSRIKNLNMKDMAPELQPAIASLQEGQYTPPLQTGMGFYVFYLEKRRVLSKIPLEKVRTNIEMQLKQQVLSRKTSEWIAEQRQNVDIKSYP